MRTGLNTVTCTTFMVRWCTEPPLRGSRSATRRSGRSSSPVPSLPARSGPPPSGLATTLPTGATLLRPCPCCCRLERRVSRSSALTLAASSASRRRSCSPVGTSWGPCSPSFGPTVTWTASDANPSSTSPSFGIPCVTPCASATPCSPTFRTSSSSTKLPACQSTARSSTSFRGSLTLCPRRCPSCSATRCSSSRSSRPGKSRSR
mmetsp:Transcript_8313/g.26561  ORF Transcript_8313/g.26561 Transcript_8313/m.26561 type:complete len:205 (-) Transcript_8313:527-1141(-)